MEARVRLEVDGPSIRRDLGGRQRLARPVVLACRRVPGVSLEHCEPLRVRKPSAAPSRCRAASTRTAGACRRSACRERSSERRRTRSKTSTRRPLPRWPSSNVSTRLSGGHPAPVPLADRLDQRVERDEAVARGEVPEMAPQRPPARDRGRRGSPPFACCRCGGGSTPSPLRRTAAPAISLAASPARASRARCTASWPSSGRVEPGARRGGARPPRPAPLPSRRSPSAS